MTLARRMVYNALEASVRVTPDNERRTYVQAPHPGCWNIAPCCVRPVRVHDSGDCEGGSDLPFQHDSGVSCDVHPYPDAAERIQRFRRANIHSASGLANNRQSDTARIV
jgi:hypothetical protein